jgi:hypothetical protein
LGLLQLPGGEGCTLNSAIIMAKKRGRPRKQLDARQVETLAAMGCTGDEIAAVCGVSRDTVDRNYADALKVGRERGTATLRRQQWKLMRNGNVTMAIWLGKQMLGQKDRTDMTTGDQPIKFHEMSFEGERKISGRFEESAAGGNGNGKH